MDDGSAPWVSLVLFLIAVAIGVVLAVLRTFSPVPLATPVVGTVAVGVAILGLSTDASVLALVASPVAAVSFSRAISAQRRRTRAWNERTHEGCHR